LTASPHKIQNETFKYKLFFLLPIDDNNQGVSQMVGIRPGIRQIRRYRVGSQFSSFNTNKIGTRIIKEPVEEIEAPEFNKEPIVDLIDEGDVLRLTIDLVTELLKEGKIKIRNGAYKNGVLEISLYKIN